MTSSPKTGPAREGIVETLTQAYWGGLETVMSYLADSTNPDGVGAQEVVRSLAADVAEEFGDAQLVAKRIKELYGTVPGSKAFTATQDALQPPVDSLDLVHVIGGVIEAERGATEHDTRIIEGRRRRPGHAGHADHDPRRRAEPPAYLRGVSA